MKIEAEFVTSAAGASGLPADGLSEIVLIGRSNVGKSSLINALARKRIARTSAAPGKTRLANVYRFERGDHRPFYVVDLPGYGYARGGVETAREFARLTGELFARVRPKADTTPDKGSVPPGATPDSCSVRPETPGAGSVRLPPSHEASAVRRSLGGGSQPDHLSALLLVDARHPGLASDRDAWVWLKDTLDRPAIVVTKIDKLARGQRIRALREFESVFEDSVLPVSAVTGEGLDELWNLIDTLAASSRYPQPRRSPNNRRHPKATAPRLPKK